MTLLPPPRGYRSRWPRGDGDTEPAHEFPAHASAEGRNREAWDLIFRACSGQARPALAPEDLLELSDELGSSMKGSGPSPHGEAGRHADRDRKTVPCPWLQPLYAANEEVVGGNPNLIYPGQKITISEGIMTVG